MENKTSPIVSKEIDESGTLMSHFARSSHVSASPKEVFVNLADLERHLASNDKQIFSISLMLGK